MKCDRCGTPVAASETREHLGETLCEDCCMEALSPVKACDPWAVHSAKNHERHSRDERILTARQMDILKILEADGPMEPSALLERLDGRLELQELEREFASLRHLEKVRGEKQGQRVLWRLW